MISGVIDNIKKNKQRKKSGKVNAVPIGLPRFSRYYPGQQKGRYILLTAHEKVGKSTITDTLLVINPIKYVLDNPSCGFDLEYHYFLLEEREEARIAKIMCRRILEKLNIIISPSELYSIQEELDSSIIDFIESDTEYLNSVLNKIKFYTGYSNVEKIKSKILFIIKNNLNKIKDPDFIFTFVIDHYSQLSGDISMAIRELSSFFIRIRNEYNVTIIAIQQQTPSGKGIEAVKLNRLYPTVDNLHWQKATAQDADIVLGIFNPQDHKQYANSVYEGIDLRQFNNNIRFIDVIRSRHGRSNVTGVVYFEGASGTVEELPIKRDAIKLFLQKKKIKWKSISQLNRPKDK